MTRTWRKGASSASKGRKPHDDDASSAVNTADKAPPPTRAFVEGIPVSLADPKDDPGLEAKVPPAQRRNKAADKTTMSPPSRFSLRMTAAWWRSLQYIGMSLHFVAPPRPPNPDFTKTIATTLGKNKKDRGTITLQFYTPAGYSDTGSTKGQKKKSYPAVVNFHGGGFVLGAATDDARFGRYVTQTAGAIFISVDYRLAPENPFPTAVEDGTDALLYVIRNAEKLHIDPMQLATSGFSAGGNICLTSLLRLGEYKEAVKAAATGMATGTAAAEYPPLPEHRIVAAATWYPILDYKRTRAERRANSKRPDQALPSTLTDLFDASYLHPIELDLLDPYLSPSQATDERLARDLPPHIIFYTCEWDMLEKEGEEFAMRLRRPPINKDVYYNMIAGVPHGWDKSPNPIKPAEASEELYEECSRRLRRIFDESTLGEANK